MKREMVRNWTNDNVFDARDQLVELRDGSQHRVKLYADGWALGEVYQRMDIWQMRAMLNNSEAQLVVLS